MEHVAHLTVKGSGELLNRKIAPEFPKIESNLIQLVRKG